MNENNIVNENNNKNEKIENENEQNNKIEEKEENNQQIDKKEEITENKTEEVNKNKEDEDSQKIQKENENENENEKVIEKNEETNTENITNQNIENNNENTEAINDNKNKEENNINVDDNKVKNEENKHDSNKNESETEKNEKNVNSTPSDKPIIENKNNEEQKAEKIETNNENNKTNEKEEKKEIEDKKENNEIKKDENKEKIESKENNIEVKKEEVSKIIDNNEKKEENNNEIKENKDIDKKEPSIENNNKSENKDNDNIEKKESTNEVKDDNNANSNTANNSESKKETGVKRSAIQGKLNKFRKQFGKTRKSKKIESSKELDKSNDKKEEKKEDKKEEKKEEKKENNLNNNENSNNLNEENKNLNNNDTNNNVEKKIIENINSMNDNEAEIKRTNTLEEMFKKKIEDGFDTETNNILDLGKNHNNRNDSNILNDIQDKLGINFNEVINLNNNNSNDNQDKKDILNNNNNTDKNEANNKENINEKDSNNIKTEFNTDDKHDSKQFINPDDRPIHPSTSNIFETKKYIDPDDRPIRPSISNNFNFDLDFEEQEKILQKKDMEIKERKLKKLNTTRQKNLFEDKDLDELGKMDFSKKSNSKNGSGSNKKFISEEIDNRKIKPFVIENNNEILSNDAKEINSTLNNINETINSLTNLNLIKKNNDDERRPKIKIDDFQKKLELALEQEHEHEQELAGGDMPNPEENNSNNKEKSNKLAEDPRFDKIKEILGKEIVDSLFSQKWESKKHGYELINNFLETSTVNDFNSNDLFEYIRLKLKNFKETNFNVNREAMNVFITLTKKKLINKENLLSVVMTYYDKITDTKLKDNYLELLNSSISIVEPNTLIKQLLTKITKKNNVKLLIEYSLFLGKIVEVYNNKELPYKEITNFCKIMANNNNPQSRNAGTNLICILYKYYGEEVHKLINDIKESTLKNIEAELSKITVIEKKNSSNLKSRKSITKLATDKNYNKNINGNGGEKELNGAENGESKPNVAIDISKKITPQILKDISDGKWAEKKEACEQVEKILTEANMKILPNGLNDLMNLIKKKLTDGNKNIVRMMVNLLTELIEALKHGFKQWSKYIALNLIPNLSDKNQILRNECQVCFDKWVEFVGFDTLIIYFPSFLKNDNIEIRTEIMNFINKYKNKFNKEIGVQVFKEMSSNLLLCLQDRSSSVRSQAEETIKLSLNYIKLNIYYDRAKEYKPAITKDLTLILDKIQNEINGNNSTTNESNSNVSNSKNNNSNNNNNNNEESIDIEKESNININELLSMNSNSNNNSNHKKNTNGNGASTNRTNHHKSISTAHKKEDSGYLKSNSTILGGSNNNKIDSNLNINETMSKKFKKSTNKLKTRKSLNTSTASINSGSKSKEKDSSIDKRHKTKELPSYKTCSNFNKKKNTEKDASSQKLVKKDTTKLLKTVEKKQGEEKETRPSLAKTVNQKSNENSGNERHSLAQKLGFSKIKGISQSLILKKTDKKSKKDLQVFASNIKVVPNKSKRLEKDLKYKFSLEYIAKDSSTKTKLKDTCKNLFTDDFNQKIFSDDFKNNALAMKEMKEQLDKKINIPIYFDNLDLILKIIGIKVNGNTNPTLVKNLFEFLESLYTVIKEKGHVLNEIETNIIISILIDKISIINFTLKELLYKLLNSYIELNDINKIMLVVLNISLGKNTKIKTEILEYVNNLNNNKNLNIVNKNYAKIFGKYLCVNDNSIKSKVLPLLKEIYSEMKEELFAILDFLPDKDREYLEKNVYVDNEDDEEEEVEINNNYHIGMNSSDEDEEENNNDNDNDNDNNANNDNNNKNENVASNQIIANGAEITEKNFLKILNNALSDNSAEQISSMVSINVFVYQKYEENKQFLKHNIDNIIKVFIEILHKLFVDSNMNLNQNSIKFIRYTTSVLLKCFQNKDFINNISYKVLYELTTDLLNYLLIEGINNIEDGNLILRTINSSMLRLIDNCDKNDMILILLEIMKINLDKGNQRMKSLSIKCLMKCIENLKDIINELNLNQIFTQLHLIIYNYDIIYPDFNNVSNEDSFILKFIRGFISNIAYLKGEEEILKIYNNSIKNNSELEDKYIIYWIKSHLEKIKHHDEKNVNNINKINNKTENSNMSNYDSNSCYNENNKDKNEDNKNADNKKENNKNIINNKKDNEKNVNDKEDDNNKSDNGHNKVNMIEELKNKWNNVKPK